MIWCAPEKLGPSLQTSLPPPISCDLRAWGSRDEGKCSGMDEVDGEELAEIATAGAEVGEEEVAKIEGRVCGKVTVGRESFDSVDRTLRPATFQSWVTPWKPVRSGGGSAVHTPNDPRTSAHSPPYSPYTGPGIE
jgi:hypothetical protein